jgi:hypothetical protein
MANEIEIIEGQKALVRPKRMNYEIAVPNGGSAILKRDVDFGVIPKTKKPSLYKSGAEKICFAYGLMQRYYIESKVEEFGENPFFHYLVRCDLVKLLPNGQEIIFTSGYGSANTKEKRNGFNGAYDAANSNLKMACKRSLVMAAISICGGSDLFTMDVEDESFVTKNFEEIKQTSDDNAPITTKQVKRLFAIGNEAGRNVEQIKQILASKGYTSTKDIKQAQYDEICRLVGKEDGKEEAKEE